MWQGLLHTVFAIDHQLGSIVPWPSDILRDTIGIDSLRMRCLSDAGNIRFCRTLRLGGSAFVVALKPAGIRTLVVLHQAAATALASMCWRQRKAATRQRNAAALRIAGTATGCPSLPPRLFTSQPDLFLAIRRRNHYIRPLSQAGRALAYNSN
jgi:hypothetical protein